MHSLMSLSDRSKTDFRNRTLNTSSMLRSFYCTLQKDFQSLVFLSSLRSFMTTLMSNSLTLNYRFSTALLLSTRRNTYRLSLVFPSFCRWFLELKFFWARSADWPNMLLVIPVSAVTAERSFSFLRRLKSYLRSTMSQRRLNHVTLSSAEVWSPEFDYNSSGVCQRQRSPIKLFLEILDNDFIVRWANDKIISDVN